MLNCASVPIPAAPSSVRAGSSHTELRKSSAASSNFCDLLLIPAASAWFDANEASLAPLCVDRDVARCQDGDARGYSCAVQTPAVWNAWQGKFPGRRGTG